jgi:hypothetical protein
MEMPLVATAHKELRFHKDLLFQAKLEACMVALFLCSFVYVIKFGSEMRQTL